MKKYYQIDIIIDLFKAICISLGALFIVYGFEFVIDMAKSFYDIGFEMGKGNFLF